MMIARMHSIRVGLLPLVLAACFSEGPATTEPNGDGDDVAATVDMTQQLTFAPASVTVRVGQTVRWVNRSSLVHTVTADPALANDPSHVRLPTGAATFNSGNVAPGASYNRTFTVAGTYEYVCLPHEGTGMVGTVVVNP